MVDKESIERLKELFVTRGEYNTFRVEVTKTISDNNTETERKLSESYTRLARMEQKLDSVVWVSRTLLAAVLVGIISAILSLILK